MAEMNYRSADQPWVDTSADRHNGSGCLRARNQRQPDRIRLPGTMLQIDVVDPDPPVMHHHLARRGHRVRLFGRHELFGAAVTRDLHCEHCYPRHRQRRRPRRRYRPS